MDCLIALTRITIDMLVNNKPQQDGDDLVDSESDKSTDNPSLGCSTLGMRTAKE